MRHTYDGISPNLSSTGSLLALMNHSIDAGPHAASSKTSTPMDFPPKDTSPLGGSLSAYTSALHAPLQPTTQSSMSGSASMTSLSSQTQETRQQSSLSALHSMNGEREFFCSTSCFSFLFISLFWSIVVLFLAYQRTLL